LHSLQTTPQFSDAAPVIVTWEVMAASGKPSSQCVLGRPGRRSPAAPLARVGLDPGKGGGAAGEEDGMDQACRPGMESVRYRLTGATWLPFGSSHQWQGADGIWDVWLVLG